MVLAPRDKNLSLVSALSAETEWELCSSPLSWELNNLAHVNQNLSFIPGGKNELWLPEVFR